MNTRVLALVLLVALIIAAVFGVYLTFGPMHHGAGCPLVPFETALCGNSALAHLKHWQSAFAAVLAGTLLLVVVVLALAALLPELFRVPELHAAMLPIGRRREPPRPTLMQELLSDGIIHRKELHLML